jgi:hypothetical protein
MGIRRIVKSNAITIYKVNIIISAILFISFYLWDLFLSSFGILLLLSLIAFCSTRCTSSFWSSLSSVKLYGSLPLWNLWLLSKVSSSKIFHRCSQSLKLSVTSVLSCKICLRLEFSSSISSQVLVKDSLILVQISKIYNELEIYHISYL